MLDEQNSLSPYGIRSGINAARSATHFFTVNGDQYQI
jgi:hypothetical protein